MHEILRLMSLLLFPCTILSCSLAPSTSFASRNPGTQPIAMISFTPSSLILVPLHPCTPTFHRFLPPGEITDAASLAAALKGIDCVFHAASYGRWGREIVEERKLHSVNLDGTLALVQVRTNRTTSSEHCGRGDGRKQASRSSRQAYECLLFNTPYLLLPHPSSAPCFHLFTFRPVCLRARARVQWMGL